MVRSAWREVFTSSYKPVSRSEGFQISAADAIVAASHERGGIHKERAQFFFLDAICENGSGLTMAQRGFNGVASKPVKLHVAMAAKSMIQRSRDQKTGFQTTMEFKLPDPAHLRSRKMGSQ